MMRVALLISFGTIAVSWLASAASSIPALKDTVMVAVTGYGQQHDRRRSREAGFDHHWIKPLSAELLSELLAALDAAKR